MKRPEIGEVYRIPWRCDQLAVVDGLPYGTLVALKWLDPGRANTEPGVVMLIKDFCGDPKPILVEGLPHA